MDSKQQTRFLIAALLFDGFAIANQAEQVVKTGWTPSRMVRVASLAAGALWAAKSIESEIGSAHRWMEFYRLRYEDRSS